jgi:hypothetical protein
VYFGKFQAYSDCISAGVKKIAFAFDKIVMATEKRFGTKNSTLQAQHASCEVRKTMHMDESPNLKHDRFHHHKSLGFRNAK